MVLTILATGGAGFIGSHTVLELLNAGYSVVCIDNNYNSYHDKSQPLPESLNRVEELTGKKVIYYTVDVCDMQSLDVVFKKHKIDCVVHFAAYKAVGESVRVPLQYYQNNVTGMCILLEVMSANGVFNLVYSSSSTVYGTPKSLPSTETSITGNCTNPYGRTKYFTEEILKDVCISDKKWNVISLRYFNPIGAHKSGLIGEFPKGEPKNLLPYITRVALGKLEKLKIFGNDYPTRDGTGVRDYSHVVDIAEGHVAALKKLSEGKLLNFQVFNLAVGKGYSVLEVVKTFEKVSGHKVAYEFVARRPGDIAENFASAALAEKVLDWKAKRGLEEMCEDAWRWQMKNPNGFA